MPSFKNDDPGFQHVTLPDIPNAATDRLRGLTAWLLLGLTALPIAAQEASSAAKPAAPEATSGAPSTLAEVQRRGTLRYTSVPEQMNAFLALDLDVLKKTGKKQGKGIDFDLLRRLADRLGVELELVLPEEPTLPALWRRVEEQQADIAVGGLSILPERKRRFDFSEPYYQTDLAVIGRCDSPWTTIEEVRGLRQSMIPEASSAAYWMELARPEGKILEADFTIGVISQVADGESDIGIEDYALARSYVDELEEVDILFTVPLDDFYGIAFQKGSELVPLMDEILRELKESGELKAIIDHHLR